MQVFTPDDVTQVSSNKYLGVLIAAKYARTLNEFPGASIGREKKMTTSALEALSEGDVEYKLTARKRQG
jgi:DNA-directed RNA polymerase subunit K/omega